MPKRGSWTPIRRRIDAIRYGRRYRSIRFAKNYDAGKAFEGYQGHLFSSLQSIVNLTESVVVDIGTGTGQISRRIAHECGKVFSLDRSASMIEFAASRYASIPNIEYAVSDAHELPLKDNTADVVIYGWSLMGMLAPKWDEDWRADLRTILSEAIRVLRDGGSICVFETMSIGGELPAGNVWHPKRRELMEALLSSYGFERLEFSNDWDFGSRKNLRFYAPIWFDRRGISEGARTGSTIIRENAALLWRSY